MPAAPALPVRLLVAASVVLTAWLFTRSAADPVNVIKLSALAACTALAVGALAVRVIRDRAVTVPASPAGAVAVALLLAFGVSALVAPQGTTAVLGVLGRNSGLVAYGCACLMLLLTLMAFDAPATRYLALAVLLAGAGTALYGVLQLADLDPIPWNNPFNPVIAALGNPDFASGYLGIAAPAAAWGALWTGWPLAARVVSGALSLAMITVAVISEAVLGPIAGAAGLMVVLLAVALGLEPRSRRPALAGLVLTAVAGVAGLLLGLTGRGPAAPFFSGTSYEARTWYWSAAIDMWERKRLLGVGLDSYGTYWWLERPLAAPRLLGGGHFSDSAHGVPLQHLAQGGLLLLSLYLALTVLVGVALVQGLWRLRGQERLLLAGLGGSWVAYHVQSLVSIDQVPLLTVHFVLAGAVLVAAGRAGHRVVRLPGAPAQVSRAQARRTGSRSRPAEPQPRPVTGPDVALLGLVGVVVLSLLWFSLVPLRASRAVYDGDAAYAAGDGNAALTAYERAVDLVPGSSGYRAKKATVLSAVGQNARALAELRAALEVDPYNISVARTAGQLAEVEGDLELAREMYVRANELVPSDSSVIAQLAVFDLKHSRAAEARELLETWAPRLPEALELWVPLGDARAVLGDPVGAREAYERKLELKPDDPDALEGLRKLDAAA